MIWDKSIVVAPNIEALAEIKQQLTTEIGLLYNDKSAISSNALLALQMRALDAMGFSAEALSNLCEIPKEIMDNLTTPLENIMNSGQFFRLTRTISILSSLLVSEADVQLQNVLKAVQSLVPQELLIMLSGVSQQKMEMFCNDSLVLSADEKFKLLTVVGTVLKVFEIRESSIYTTTNTVNFNDITMNTTTGQADRNGVI